MRKEITVKSIAALERAGGRITDTKIRGFVARCLPSGKIQFGYQYGSRPARRWINIGLRGQRSHQCRARALIFPPGVDLASSRGVVSINAKPKPPIERRRQAGPNGAYCPANTCAGNGGSYANNVRFCSPKNCRR
jgi:hypothetical protein